MKHPVLILLFSVTLQTACNTVIYSERHFLDDNTEWTLNYLPLGRKSIVMDGKVIVKGKFDSVSVCHAYKAGEFFELYNKNGKACLCNLKGDILTPAEYSSFYISGEGTDLETDFRIIALTDHYSAAYTMNGVKQIDEDKEYTRLSFFAGYYTFVKNGFSGACSADGAEVIAPERYTKVSVMPTFEDKGEDDYSPGPAIGFLVQMEIQNPPSKYEKWKVGYCSTDGKEMIPPVYDDIDAVFPIRYDDNFYHRDLDDDDNAYIDYHAEPLLYVKTRKEDYKREYYTSLANLQGELLIACSKGHEPYYYIYEDPLDGLVWVSLTQNDEQIIMDNRGNILATEPFGARYRWIARIDGKIKGHIRNDTEDKWVNYVFPDKEAYFQYPGGQIFISPDIVHIRRFGDNFTIGNSKPFEGERLSGGGYRLYMFSNSFSTSPYFSSTTSYYYFTDSDLSYLYAQMESTYYGWTINTTPAVREYLYPLKGDKAPNVKVANKTDMWPSVNYISTPSSSLPEMDTKQYKVKEIKTYEECDECRGKKTVEVSLGSLSFSVDDTKYCSECGQRKSPHTHVPCRRCHGTGQIERITYQTVYE